VSIFGKLMVFTSLILSIGGLGVAMMYLADERQFGHELAVRKWQLNHDEHLRGLDEVRLRTEVAARISGSRMVVLNPGANPVTIAAARQEVRDQELGNPMRSLRSLADLGSEVDKLRLAFAKATEALQQARLKNEQDTALHAKLSKDVEALLKESGLIADLQKAELEAKQRLETLRYPLFFERMKIAIIEKRNIELDARKKELMQKGLITLAP
jgi:hypothetical protein